MNSPQSRLDFGLIQEPLDTALRALEYKVEREWPTRFEGLAGARETLLVLLKLSRNTYRTILYIAADHPADPLRKPLYVLSIPPLNRTILDSLFNVVFMFEDFSARVVWYQKSGWREVRNEVERCRDQYGQLADWQEWLRQGDRMLQGGIAMFAVTSEEQRDPTKIRFWPLPSKMIRYGASIGPLTRERAFLAYLQDWFYRELSAMSHISAYAMTRVGAALLSELLPEPERERVETEGIQVIMSANVGRTATLEAIS